MRTTGTFVWALLLLCLTGCGTFTGIPSHGGGKRFAVEQELISASARAASMTVDVSELVGQRVALYVVTIGDEGAGNLVGGRYDWQASLRSEFVQQPVIKTSDTRIKTGGLDYGIGGATVQAGPTSYFSEAFINPKDAFFLQAVLSEAMILQGVIIVSPDQADIDVYVTVDVFGTHRTRVDYHVYNQEKLLAKTAFQITAFDRDRNLILPPRTSSYEAEYAESYVLWCGPINVQKAVRNSDELLVDYRAISPRGGAPARVSVQREESSAPTRTAPAATRVNPSTVR